MAEQNLSYYLGPNLSAGLLNLYRPVAGLLNAVRRNPVGAARVVAENVGPQADIKGMVDSYGSAMQNFGQGNIGAGLLDAAYVPANAATVLLPGMSASGMRNTAKALSNTLGDVPAKLTPASMHGTLGDIAGAGHNGPPVSMYDMPAGSDPRYLGAARDRNEFSLLRYRPKKETGRVDASIAAMADAKNPVRQQLEADIDRGVSVGGADWYNTEELRDWFVSELGDAEGSRQWSEFIDLIGATSPGSKVPKNIQNASAMRQRMGSDPEYAGLLGQISTIDEARQLARGRLPSFGHKTQGLQEQVASRQRQGRWSGEPEPGVAATKSSAVENPKPKGFSWSLKGSEKNIAADLHFTRYMAMASRDPRWLTTQAEIGAADADRILALGPKKLGKYFGSREVDGKTMRYFNAKKAVKEGAVDVDGVADLNIPGMWAEKPNDSEYRALENLMYEIGQTRGMTAPQVQAALWMGAADRTGVDVSSQKTFMEAIRSVADKRAAKEGLTREQVLRRFIRDKGLLAVPGVGVAGLLGSGAYRQQSE